MRRPASWVGVALALLLLAYAACLRLGWVGHGPLFGATAPIALRLDRPWLALAAPVATLLLAWVFARASRRGARAHVEEALIFLTALALSLVATGPQLGRPLDRMTVIVVVDRSRSIELVEGATALVDAELVAATEGMRDGDRLAVVAFGARAVTEQPPRTKDEPALGQRAVVPADGTDIEAAIRRAVVEVPPDSAARIVLITDGVATRGDTLGAGSAAVAAQVPIDTLVLERREMPAVRVDSVRTSTRGDAGATVDLRVVTHASQETAVEVRVILDGRPIRRGAARVAAGQDVLLLREKLPDAGMHRYDVEISAVDPALDASGDDNAQSAFVRVRGRPSVLVVEGDPGMASFVSGSLERAELGVDVTAAAGLPSDLGGFLAYDLVVLSDVPAAQMSPSQIDAIGTYVKSFGGGVLLLGGDRSLGPGGFGKTAIEEISPVSFDLKQDERRAKLAEVIAIDISGSMSVRVGDRTKLELANEAASRAAELLGEGDSIGVEHVDTQVHWTVPLAPVVDKVAIDRAIRSMPVGGGGILVPITLVEGYAALDAESSSLKHLLLFSDGDDAEDVDGAKTLAVDALRRGMTTSVIALGEGKDTAALAELASLGGGRFYSILDASRLPAVFAQETILASRSALVEEPFFVQAGAPGAPVAGIDFSAAPELLGYVVTVPKPRATVHLSGPDEDPVLASWSVGLGRAAVFTSDLKDRWGLAWTQWPGAARMLAQIARDLVRRDDDDRVRLETVAANGRLEVRATATSAGGRADSLRRLRAKVSGPDGLLREVELEPTSVGAYSASVPLDRPGTYVAVVLDEATGEAVGTSGAAWSSGDEMRAAKSDVGLLDRLSNLTGGSRRTSLREVFHDRAMRRFSYEDSSAMLAAFAAFALLASVVARKLGFPDALVPALERVRRRLGTWSLAAPPPVPPSSGPSTGSAVEIAPVAPPEGPNTRPLSTAELLVARRKTKK